MQAQPTLKCTRPTGEVRAKMTPDAPGQSLAAAQHESLFAWRLDQISLPAQAGPSNLLHEPPVRAHGGQCPMDKAQVLPMMREDR